MTIPNPADSPEAQLRRFLYMNGETNSYLTGDPEVYKRFTRDNLRCLDELLKADPAKVCRIISTINSENLLPRREGLFFVLAAALTSSIVISDVYRRELYTTVLYTCKDDEDFFNFIKFVSKFKKTFSSGMNKVISRYYKNKEPMDLVKDVCKRRGYHSWTHKDLIKLSHIKTDNNLQQIALVYTLKGIEEAEKLAHEKKEGKDIIKYIKKNIEFKTSQSDEYVRKYIETHRLAFDQVPAQYKKDGKVLESLLPHIDVRSLLELLLRLWKVGNIRSESTSSNKVVKILQDAGKVKASGVHPVEVFLALRNFEKGGKPKDAKLITYLEEREKKEKEAQKITGYPKTNFGHVEPIKCPHIVSALNKCLTLSFQNVEPTNRRFLITMEVSDQMDKPCLNSKNLTSYEAAAIEILTYLKSEKNVIVAVFNGPEITQVDLDKGASVNQTIKKLKEAEHGEIQMGAPIQWAKTKKKPIDVFINILHTPTHQHFQVKDKPLVNPLDAYVKYKSAMNMSSTKLVLHNMHQPIRTCFNESSLDVRGFDKYIPKIIDAYIKNLI